MAKVVWTKRRQKAAKKTSSKSRSGAKKKVAKKSKTRSRKVWANTLSTRDVEKALDALFPDPDQVIELRALDVPAGQRSCTAGGYFTNRAGLLSAVRTLDRRGAAGIYVCVNHLHDKVLARAKNKIAFSTHGAAKDRDIDRRSFLFIDIDPKRQSGTSANEAEITLAKAKLEEVRNGLETAFGAPAVEAFSGNGFHLLYRIDMPSNADASTLIKSFLKIVSDQYSDDGVTIDKSVHNPSRIIRLYGTVARKGESRAAEGRQHRRSEVLSVSDNVVSADTLRSFVAKHKDTQPKHRTSRKGLGRSCDDLCEYLVSCGVFVKERKPLDDGSIALIVNGCPMNPDHGRWTDTAVIWSSSGVGFKCHHDSCSEYSWSAVRDKIDPGWRDRPRLGRPSASNCHIEYEPFPIDVLPTRVRRYVEEASAAIGCDHAYLAVPHLAALASAIGNSRNVLLKRSWTEPSVVWTAICAESGTLKSPALDKATAFVREMQAEALSDHDQAREEYERQKELYEAQKKARTKPTGGELPPKPKRPAMRRYYVHDTTIEALADRLEANPRGLLVISEELAAWLRGFERYGQSTDLSNWLCLHNARPLVVDRKNRERPTIIVPLASVSVTGTIQPGVLAKLFDDEAFDSGLAARLLIAMPPRPRRRWSEADISPICVDGARQVFEKLHLLQLDGEGRNHRPVSLPLTDDAKRAWVQFHNEHGIELNQLEGALAASWAKLEGYAARFALIVALCKGAESVHSPQSVKSIDEESVRAGITLTRWFGRETERVHSLFGAPDGVPTLNRLLLDFVRNHGPVTTRDIACGVSGIDSSDEAERALKSLIDLDVVKAEDSKPGRKGGRPTVRYLICDETDESLSKPKVSSRIGFVEGPKRSATKGAKRTKEGAKKASRRADR